MSVGFGQSVTVRHGEVETIEYNRDKGLSVTVYLGQQRGNASTSDFTPQAVRDTVDAALSIARYTAKDDCSGLPDADMLARDCPDMDLYHPWDLPVDAAIELAKRCEQAALDADKRISNSEGATVNLHEAQFITANSLGFIGGFPTSRHSLSCAVIAGEDDAMERDYWYAVARDAGDLMDAQQVGRIAAERTVRRLNARQIATMQVPVLFEATIASGLLGSFVSAVSGGSLYRKSSFLLDQMGKQVFAPHINISDVPDIRKGLASSPFDDEGVRTQRRDIVENGVLRGYFLGSYSARKLGMRTTGNAGGNHNLILQSGATGFQRVAEADGARTARHGVAGPGSEPGHRRLFARRGGLLGGTRRNSISGSGNHDRRKPERHVPQHRRGRQRCAGARLASQCGSILLEGMTVAGR